MPVSLYVCHLDWYDQSKMYIKVKTGMAYWQTRMVNDIRVRRVEYSPATRRIIGAAKVMFSFVMEEKMNTELKDGRVFRLRGGMCYLVGDNNEAHQSSTATGCKLFIV